MDQGQLPDLFRRTVDLLKAYRWLWIAPTILSAIISSGYALIMQRPWGATQSILVRDETGANLRGLGKFDTQEAMKTAQETILEIARNRSTIADALKVIGPSSNSRNADAWPTPDDIDEAQDHIVVRAPNGTEFGKSELLHISVKRENRERAVAFITALCDQLETRLREVRHMRFQSIVDEIEKRARVAKTDLDAATNRLQTLEADVGSDLGELRILSEPGSGEGTLRGQQNLIRNEIRQAEAQCDSLKQLRELLVTAQQNPTQFLATPSRLLESQPGLKRAKENVLDAQAECAKVAGQMSPNHPKVKECEAALIEMRQNLYRELNEAGRGIDADLQVSEGLVQSLNKQLLRVNQRLDQLANLRAQYVNLVTDVRRCNEMLEKTNKELTDARASHSSADSASLVNRVGAPIPGDRPIGPGRATIMLTGLGGGLAIGLGLVFLVMPMKPTGSSTAYARTSDPMTSNIPPAGALVGGRRNNDPPLGGIAINGPPVNGRERRSENRRRTSGRRTSDHVSPNNAELPPLIALPTPGARPPKPSNN